MSHVTNIGYLLSIDFHSIMTLYSGYVMYYKPGLKYYYYFRVYSNKYYCLLKKKNSIMTPLK